VVLVCTEVTMGMMVGGREAGFTVLVAALLPFSMFLVRLFREAPVMLGFGTDWQGLKALAMTAS